MPVGPISEAFVAILPLIDEAAFSAEVETGVSTAVAKVGGKAFAPLEVQAAKAGQRAGVALDESFSKASSALTAGAAKTGTKAGAALDASFTKAVAPLGKEAAAAGDKAAAVGTSAKKGASSGLVGLAALAGGYELVKGSIEKAQQRQLDQIRSTEVFGKRALPTVQKSTEEVGKATIQTIELTQESINTLGQSLQAVGVTQKQSLGLSAALSKRIGDVAAKTGTDVQTLIGSVQTSLASGSTRALRSLQVVADASDISFTAAKDGLVKVKGEIPQLISAQTKVAVAQKAYNDAVAKSGAGSTVAQSAKKALDAQNIALSQTTAKYKDVAKTLPELKAQQSAVAAAQAKYNAAVDKFGPSSAKAKSAQAAYNDANSVFLTSVKAQVPALTKQQKALALTHLILDKTTSSQGAAEKRSHTFNGAIQSLKVAFSNFEEEVGVVLIPVLTKIANIFSSFFGFLQKHTTVVKILTTTLAVLGGVLLAYKTGLLLAAAAEKVMEVQTAILNAVMDANPITLIVIALAALVVALVEAYKHSATFRAIVQDIGNFLKTVFIGALHLLADAFDFVRSHILLVVTILATAFLGPIAIVIGLFIKFHSQIIGVLTDIYKAVASFIGGVIHFFAALPGNIVKALSSLGKLIGEVFTRLGQLILKLVRDFIKLWLEVYVKFPLSVLKALAGLAGKVAAIFIQVGKQSLSAVTGWVGKIFSAIATLPGKIIGLGGKMLSAGAHLMDQLFSGIKKGVGAVGDFGKSIANSIGQAINHFLHLPIHLPRFNTHIPGVGTIGGETVLPAIPAFKRGGVIDKATLALLGEAGREVIIPMTNHKRALQLANQSGLLDLLVAQSNRESRGSLASVTTDRSQSRTTTNHNTFVLPAADPQQHAEMIGHRLASWSDR